MHFFQLQDLACLQLNIRYQYLIGLIIVSIAALFCVGKTIVNPYFSSFPTPQHVDLLCLSSANHYQFSDVLSYQLQTGTSGASAPN